MATTIEAPPSGPGPEMTEPESGGTPGTAPSDRLTEVVAGGDHKTTGRLFIGFSLVFGILGLAATAAYEATAANESWASTAADASFQLFTLGRLLLLFGFVVPMFVGLAILLVPLQVGAATVAFPRAAALAFWVWLTTTAMLCACYLANGGVGGGSKNAQLLALLCVIGMVVALLLGSTCAVVTAIGFRAPNMTMNEVPLYTWAFLVAASVWLLTLPVWLGNVILVFIDVRYGVPGSFGAVNDQWAQLGWILSPPQVFAFAIPVLGVAGDSVATLSGGVRMRSRGAVLSAIGAFGLLSIGAWAQPYFVPKVYTVAPAIGQTVLLIVPVLVIVTALASTMRRGSPRAASPALAALAAMLLLATACIGAILFTIGNFSLQKTPGGLNLTAAALAAPDAAPLYTWSGFFLLLGVAVVGAVGGLYLWSSKITGKTLGDGGGKILVLVALVGGFVAALPLAAIGFANKWSDLASSAKALFAISSIGMAVLLLALVGLGLALLSSAQRDATTPPDPWGHGQSLEWLAASPPPTANFPELPTVSSAEPLLDLNETEEKSASST